MTQLEYLRKNRVKVLSLINDPTVSRQEVLQILSCSTRALYAFMSEEGVSWVRKPHNGANQHPPSSNLKNALRRVDVESFIEEAKESASYKDPLGFILNLSERELSQKGVYRIVSGSGGVYIGKTISSFRKRAGEHRRMLQLGAHHCLGLQRAWSRDGLAIFEILESFDEDSYLTDNLISEAEVKWWEEFSKDGFKIYNGKPTLDGKSVHHTAEVKKKISESKRKSFSVEEEEFLSGLIASGRSILSLQKEFRVSRRRLIFLRDRIRDYEKSKN